jgi:hypothetical protein
MKNAARIMKLEKIFLKTKGHPWSLECFVRFSYKYPVKRLFAEIPNFSDEQQNYVNEQCWKYLSKNEKNFLMRASVFTNPLDFDALSVCTEDLSTLISLAENFLYNEERRILLHSRYNKRFCFFGVKKGGKIW